MTALESSLTTWIRAVMKGSNDQLTGTSKIFILSTLNPLGLTAAEAARDAAIHKNIFRSGRMTLIIFNEEINDIVKIVKSLEKSGLLMRGVFETIQKKHKYKEVDLSVWY